MGWQTADIKRDVADRRARGVGFEAYDPPQFKTVNGQSQFLGQVEAVAATWYRKYLPLLSR